MSSRHVAVLVLFLLITSVILTLNTLVVKSDPANIVVPDDYLTIQEAINNAINGDTIFVKNGTYYSEIIVNKTVSLVGENREATIIDASSRDYGVTVLVDNVIFAGFTVFNAQFYGMRIINASTGCIVIGNDFEDNENDILVLGPSGRNVIMHNLLSGKICIELWGSHNNFVLSNTVINSDYAGIVLRSSNNNTIRNNEVAYCEDVGIILETSCKNNVILSNNVSWNGFSGSLWSCGIGVNLGSISNLIISNYVFENRRGFYQSGSSNDNRIYHNNFINNTKQVFSSLSSYTCLNIWDDGHPSGGNFWSDYNGTDSNSDGIGDTPYIIDDNNTDNHPLMDTYHLPIYDLNYDGAINMRDIGRVARAYGSEPGNPRWDPEAELVPPYSIIDMRDIGIIARHFGETEP